MYTNAANVDHVAEGKFVTTNDLTLIIDGNNMAYRARYAFNLSFRGVDTSVTYGVIRMLQSLIGRFQPRHIIFCWDYGIPNFRKRLVPEYKAHRRKKDDPTYSAFVIQLRELEAILPYFGILQVKRSGLEADDLAYHASRLIQGKSMIVSSDGDLLQAVKENVSVLRPGKNEVILDNSCKNHTTSVIWKVLQGDKSDNIPGIYSVGPKTATKIIRSEPIPKHLAHKLAAFLESDACDNAYACMDLSVDRAGARYVLIGTKYVPYNNTKCTQWCIERGFTSLLEVSLGSLFGRLRKPIFINTLVTPRMWDYKRESVQ